MGVGAVGVPIAHLRGWRKFQFPPFLCFSFRTILTVVLPVPLGRKWRGMKPRGELRPVGAGVPRPLRLPLSPEHGSWECLCKWQERGRSLMGRCRCGSSKIEAAASSPRVHPTGLPREERAQAGDRKKMWMGSKTFSDSGSLKTLRG